MLRTLLLSSNCCPLRSNYNPCCSFYIDNVNYVGVRVKSFYKNSLCCGAAESCTVNLTECSNCTVFNTECNQLSSSPPPSPPPPSIGGNIVSNDVIINSNNFIQINVTLTNSSRKCSGFQFYYETDYVIDSFSDVSGSYISNVYQSGLYSRNQLISGFNSPVQTIMHNPASKFIIMAFKPYRQQFGRDFLYISVSSLGTFFNISDKIISDDNIPVSSYPIIE